MGRRQNPIIPPAESQPVSGQSESSVETYLNYLPPPKQRAKRSRRWETTNKAVLYRGVPTELRDGVRAVAEGLNVVVDDVARAFLEFSIECVRNGTLRLDAYPSVRPKAPRMTLFPFHGAGWAVNGWTPTPVSASPKRQKKALDEKPWRSVVAYRLPQELHQRVKDIAGDHLPVGEVASVMLRHGLENFYRGVLTLRPQPKQAALLSWDAGLKE